MKTRTINFTGDEIRATQSGRKTRFTVPIRKVPDGCTEFKLAERDKSIARFGGPFPYSTHRHVQKGAIVFTDWMQLPFRVGDRVTVRETYYISPVDKGPTFCGFYRATDPCRDVQWRSPATMPRWASRLTLEVVETEVVRLRDTTETDAIAEGITMETPIRKYAMTGNSLLDRFVSGWNARHGKRYPWETAWGLAVTFKRIEEES